MLYEVITDAAAGRHDPAAGLRHPVAAVEIDIHDGSELFRRFPRGRYGAGDAGIADQDVP